MTPWALNAALPMAKHTTNFNVNPLAVPILPPLGVAVTMTRSALDSSLAMTPTAFHMTVAPTSKARQDIGSVRHFDAHDLVLKELIKPHIYAPGRRWGTKLRPIYGGPSLWFVGPFCGPRF